MPFDELKLLCGSAADAFETLPVHVAPDQASTPEELRSAFTAMFRCEAAKAERDVVFLWVVDRPYTHDKMQSSQIVYIEKTKATISIRWRSEYLRRITTDYEDGQLSDETLRAYADVNRNWSFYSRLIRDHGPLRILWASTTRLNELSGEHLANSRAWENRLLRAYRDRHGVLPLKNRRL